MNPSGKTPFLTDGGRGEGWGGWKTWIVGNSRSSLFGRAEARVMDGGRGMRTVLGLGREGAWRWNVRGGGVELLGRMGGWVAAEFACGLES